MTCNINPKKEDLETSTSGDFILYDKKTKEKFYNDFVFNTQYRNGRRISAGRTEKEIEECYNHLTTKGDMDSCARLPDLRRYECIYILKDMLVNTSCNNCSNYYVWEKEEKYLKEKIFCPKTGYLIILLKRNSIYKFVSAYFISSTLKKQKLINECLEANKKKKAP